MGMTPGFQSPCALAGACPGGLHWAWEEEGIWDHSFLWKAVGWTAHHYCLFPFYNPGLAQGQILEPGTRLGSGTPFHWQAHWCW